MIFEIHYQAKCKDCKHIRYFYRGKLKRHECLIRLSSIRLRDKTCSHFEGSFEGIKQSDRRYKDGTVK